MKKLQLCELILISALLSGCISSQKQVDTNVSSGPVEASGDDVLVPYAWHLGNTGQTSFAGLAGTAGQDFNIAEAIALGYKGSGIKIAVSDSGVDLTHPDLDNNALAGLHRDYSGASAGSWKTSGSYVADPYPQEGEGHGTAVTGLASAEGWNTIGSRGVAPSSKYAAFYFIGNNVATTGSYEAKTLDQIWGAFDIFNYSYGYEGCTLTPVTSAVINMYKQGVTSLRGGYGAIYVKAAGNDYIGYNDDCYSTADPESYFFGNSNTNEDQNIPYLIVAAAVNAKGKISSYSTPGSGVWISSAGGEFGYSSSSYSVEKSPAMITTDITGCSYGLSTSSSTESSFNKGTSSFNLDCDYTSVMNGTSSAAPTLSGVVALMLSANPLLSWRDVKHILAYTAQKINLSYSPSKHPYYNDANFSSRASDLVNEIDGYNYDYYYTNNSAGYSFSNTYGFGRVDAYAAVQMARSYVSGLGTYEETFNPNNDGWYYPSTSAFPISIPNNSAMGVTDVINVRHNFNIESVQIKFSTNHSYIGELGVELISPNGTISKVLLLNSNIKDNYSGATPLEDYMMITNAFYNEESRGNWTIRVVDGMNTNLDDNTVHTGNLLGWSIKINGHKVASTAATTAAPTNIVMAGSDASITASPPVSFTASTGTILRYEVSVGTTPDLADKAQWYSIGNATSFQTTNMSLSAGVTYYMKIRAINNFEKASTIVTRSWVAGTP